MSIRRILKVKVAGMIVAAAALGQLPAHAALDLVSGAGSITYAKETLTTAATVSASDSADTRTYYVLSAPTGGRLSFTAPVGIAVSAGVTAQVEFDLTDMVFAGATAPTLAVAGAADATIAALAGGAEGDKAASFSVILGATALTGAEVMTLTVRGLGVLVDQPGTVRGGARIGETDPFTFAGDPVTAFRVAGGLRENVAPVSPVTRFVDGFRSFAGKLVTSLGSLSVGPRPGTGLQRAFSAATSSPVSLGHMISETAGDSTVTFSGPRGFASDLFLSEEADCSSKDEEGVLDGSGDWAAVNLEDANDRHLCIEVDGTTSIPETSAYRAVVSYGGITDAAFPPGDANLELGRVTRDGVIVHLSYVNTHPNVNFRVVVRNRMDEPAPYRFEFTPPEGTSAVGGPQAEGALPANALTLLRAANFVTVTGRRPWTGARLTVDASPEKLDVVTIQTNRSDGSTDTVRYNVPVEHEIASTSVSTVVASCHDATPPGDLLCSGWATPGGSTFPGWQVGAASRDARQQYYGQQSNTDWTRDWRTSPDRGTDWQMLAETVAAKACRALGYRLDSAAFGQGHSNDAGIGAEFHGNGLGWFYRNRASSPNVRYQARQSRTWSATCVETVTTSR